MKKRDNSNITNRTCQKIKDTFIKLYKKKGLSNITVTMLCKEAGISRSTFYAYFEDIYDLLEHIERELEESLVPFFEAYNQQKLFNNNVAPYLSTSKWFAFCMENAEYLEALMGPHGDPAFEYRIIKRLKKDINTMMDNDNMPNDNLRKYVVEYMAAATLALVRYWLEHKEELSPKDLAIVANIIREGPVLKKYLNKRNI